MIDRPYWRGPDGIRHPVKNLGWLLSHRSDVIEFSVRTKITLPAGKLASESGALLTAQIGRGDSAVFYFAEFASATVLRSFLSRPSWRGLRCLWNDHPETIGKLGNWSRTTDNHPTDERKAI